MLDLKQVIRDVCAEGWTLAYPDWVREIFVRALKTDGEFPEYAQVLIYKALHVAEGINKKMERQEAVEVDSQPKGHHRKNIDKAEADRKLRAQMKGTSGGKPALMTNPNSRTAKKRARLAKNRK